MAEAARAFFDWLASGLGVAVIVALLFWKADDLISKEGRAKLVAAVGGLVDEGPAEVGAEIERFLGGFLPPPPRTAIYARNVALLSLGALVAVGLVYFLRVGGFWLQFTSGPENRANFIAQLLTGFATVFLVNYVGLLPHRYYVRTLSHARAVTCFGILVLDVALRLALFLALSAVSYPAFARYFGSFGGDVRVAWSVLPETFALAARFGNLTGVYLYAVAVSSLPLFFAVFLRLLAAYPPLFRLMKSVVFWMPLNDRPLRLMSVMLAVFLGGFGLLVAALLGPVSGLRS